MIEKIEYLIIRHTDLMDMCTTCSVNMLKAAQAGKVDEADQESKPKVLDLQRWELRHQQPHS